MADSKVSSCPLSLQPFTIDEILELVRKTERECLLALIENARKRKEENCA